MIFSTTTEAGTVARSIYDNNCLGPEEVLDLLDGLLLQVPEEPEVLLIRAQIYEDLGYAGRAEADLRRALFTASPARGVAMYNLARFLDAPEYRAEATELARGAIGEGVAEGHLVLARDFYDRGEFREAATAATRALASESWGGRREAFAIRSQASRRLGDIESADRDEQQAALM